MQTILQFYYEEEAMQTLPASVLQVLCVLQGLGSLSGLQQIAESLQRLLPHHCSQPREQWFECVCNNVLFILLKISAGITDIFHADAPGTEEQKVPEKIARIHGLECVLQFHVVTPERDLRYFDSASR